ncbi:hypothetical protein G7Y79_00009g025750 [Physcia stellaris]|nr:hypothetical protein G7Y79_00009g025750 [Physcia stellaris]
MAGNSTTTVPLRYDLVKEIEKLLSIWSKLKGNDKQNCKKLIDSKIRFLQDCSRPRYEPTYEFMESALSLKHKLVAAKFDLGSIESVISKEMKDLMNKNGLQYSGGAEDPFANAPQFEVKVFMSAFVTASSSPTVTYMLRYEEEVWGTIQGYYRYRLYQIQGNVKTDTGVSISGRTLNKILRNHYDREDRVLVFYEKDGSMTLSLEMSSAEQACAFVEHAESKNAWFPGE